MQRLRQQDLGFKGEITAMTALIFALMLSIVGALLQSASLSLTKTQNRAVTMMALESCFAEYDTNLLEKYELFGRQGNREVILNRLRYYGAGNISHKVEQIEYLTDQGGASFYRQAIRHMKSKLGLEMLLPEEEKVSDESVEEKERLVKRELETLLSENEAELPKQENPIEHVETLKSSGLLPLLVSNPETLSNRSISVSELPSNRTLQKGNGPAYTEEDLSDRLFFTAYLKETFTNVTSGDESHPLLYEQEYLLGGKESDQANLEAVCKKILTVRTVINYTYLLSDSGRQAEAEALALTICSLLTVPEITEVAKQAILLAWAYGESIVDVRVLLKGNKVPLTKDSATWQLQLSNLVTLGTAEEVAGEKPSDTGLSYDDYLKGLLLLEKKETLCMRSLDLVESNCQIRTDQCITWVKVKSCKTDTFTTEYGYH